MLARLTGTLESLAANAALIDLGDGAAYQVLLPAYLADRLGGKWGGGGELGRTVTLHTMQYFESLNQGASFVPRLVGFASPAEREFFELLTTVKGLGSKRALRAMALEPAAIARAIHDRDARALQRLPEIGPKLAELIVHELKAKVEPFTRAIGTGAAVSGAAGGQAAGGAAREPTVEPKSPRRGRARAAEPSAPPPPPAPVAPIRQTVETLIALGESPADAERMVGRVIDQARANGEAPPSTSQALLAAAYATR